MQKKKVSEFASFVNNTKNDKLLIEILKKNNWDVNNAVEDYFTKGYGEKAVVSKQTSQPSSQKIQQLFNQYKDSHTGKIEVEGIQKFLEDLNVDPMDPVTLLISKYMNAETMGFYTKEEFEKGFKALGCQSVEDLKKKLPQLRQELQDNSRFKDFYKFVFDFSRDQGYKNISIDTAVALWELLLSDKCKFLQDWIEFLRNEKKDLQVIQKDTWTMLYELIQQTNGDFSNYVDDGAWPSLIDAFNEFYQRKHSQQKKK